MSVQAEPTCSEPIHRVLHSYSLRDYSREHVFSVVRAGGWTRVELAACHLDPGAAGEDLAAAMAQARAAGAEIHCVGYWGQFADRGDVRRITIERARAVIDACAEHGVALVNGSGGWLVSDPDRWEEDWRVNGSAMATEADYELVAAAYRELADHAAARGVRINVEIHANTVHDTAATTARLLDLVDRANLGVTVDPSNAAAISAADRDPAVLSVLGDRVTYFHLKNCVVRHGVADFTTDADRGAIDNGRWLAAIAASGQCDAVCVEYCGDGDPHPRLAASQRYLDRTLRSLGEPQAALGSLAARTTEPALAAI